ncbi:hypothetical protein TIFTF001_038032 [Ficus carica]|uniref:Uncharacterized protein n=1 Tax=Ficus carica TaxID=3494 RepID=A0AA88E6I5_FICCA|nr:hypothetical protein TIFTF001_038032 [Ficus carica]
MPYKRGKGKASSSDSSSLRLVDKKFVNEAAKAKFGKFMEKNKSMIVERGLRPPEFDIEGDIANNLVQRQWKNLTDMQDSAVAIVVREFCANGYYQRDNDEVCVRGTMVSFAPEVINRYFDIGMIEDDEYATFLEGGDYDPIVREMCIPGWSIDIGEVIRDDLVKSLEAKTKGTSNSAWVLNSMTTIMHPDLPTYSRDFAFWEGGIRFEEFQSNKHVLYRSMSR